MKSEKEKSSLQEKLVPVDFDPFVDGNLLKTVPSTEAQKEVWEYCKSAKSSFPLNESISIHLRGKLDLDCLRSALSDLVLRHDAFRTTISPDGKTLCVSSPAKVDTPMIELLDVKESARDRILHDIETEESNASFKLVKGPLFRAKIVRLKGQNHVLILTAHRIICDGWSMDVLLKDLSVIYSAKRHSSSADLEEAYQFSEYAIAQKKKTQSEEYAEDVKYWLKKLTDEFPVLNLPLGKPKPEIESYNGARENYQISPYIVADLKKVASQTGCSMFAVLLAGFKVFLSRISGQEDLIVGIPAAGQLITGKNNLVGYCMNVLPVRSQVKGEQKYTQFLNSLKTRILDAYDHNRCTAGSIFKRESVERDLQKVPLVAVFFTNTHKYKKNEIEFTDLDFDYYQNPRQFEIYEICMDVYEYDGNIELRCHYNTDLFSRKTIRKWLQQYETLLESIANDPEQSISDIPVEAKRRSQAKDRKADVNVNSDLKNPALVDMGWEEDQENIIIGLRNRFLQLLARIIPGAMTLRVFLHRKRGVKIGKGAWIGYDAIIETSRPRLVKIGNRASIGIRAVIIAHFHDSTGVCIEDDAYIGPGAIILPNVTLGHGAVVAAGSVVSVSVPPMTMVQGNPARTVGRCGIPLGLRTSAKEFLDKLQPLKDSGRTR